MFDEETSTLGIEVANHLVFPLGQFESVAVVLLGGFVVGQKDGGGCLLNERVADRGVDSGLDVGRNKHDYCVVLSQRLEPILDLRGEQGYIEELPTLFQDN